MIRNIPGCFKAEAVRETGATAASCARFAGVSSLVEIASTRNRTMIAGRHRIRTYHANSTSSACSEQAQRDRSYLKSESPKRFVKIVEVGPRDGLQNERQIVPTDNKIRFIQMLAEAGCPTVEAAAFVSPKWVPAMADGADVMEGLATWRRQLRQQTSDDDKCSSTEFSVLVPNIKGFDAAMKSGAADEVAIFASASETFSRKNINCTIDESIARFRDVVVAAKDRGFPVRGYVSCVLGCPYQGEVTTESVARLSEKLIEMGCREISLGDTIGVGTPDKTIQMIHDVERVVDKNMLAVHFHDTYGQALANIYAAVKEGISVVDSSVAGLGGCPYAAGASGNVATEDVVYMLNGMNVETRIDMDKLVDAGTYICNVLNQPRRSKAGIALVAAGIKRCHEDNKRID
mmetsp:Transcript_17942/g.29782  ORF Transcript_17942/g.29782 Transcript_17942/m.29782 type:complete len:404 (-) Transcript_17942:62-1273(-)